MEKNKKAYESPEIKKIDLTPEEAVLSGCKSAASPTGKTAGPNDCSTKQDFCDITVS